MRFLLLLSLGILMACLGFVLYGILGPYIPEEYLMPIIVFIMFAVAVLILAMKK